jgi:hypothetical protein
VVDSQVFKGQLADFQIRWQVCTPLTGEFSESWQVFKHAGGFVLGTHLASFEKIGKFLNTPANLCHPWLASFLKVGEFSRLASFQKVGGFSNTPANLTRIPTPSCLYLTDIGNEGRV